MNTSTCHKKTGIMLPEARELPKTSRQGWNRSFPSTFRGSMVPLTPSSWTSSLQGCETVHFCCLNHSVCDTLFWQHQQTSTVLLLFLLGAWSHPHQSRLGCWYFFQAVFTDLWQILEAVIKAILSHALHKAHPLCIPNKCPHLCSQQCPSSTACPHCVLELLFSVPQWVL